MIPCASSSLLPSNPLGADRLDPRYKKRIEKMKIFISCPYTQGDPVLNVRDAVMTAEEVIRKGHVPFVPLLNHLWHLISPHEVEFWYEYDLHWLDSCDAILRLPGPSVGADKEIKYAFQQGKRIYYDLASIS